MADTAPDTHDLFPKGTLETRYTGLPEAFYSKLDPELSGAEPVVIHMNRNALPEIGLKEETADSDALKMVLAGQAGVKGAEPFAGVYAGHQFGHFVPQLGDGRAVMIAEGRTESRPWELQLKGSGRTPYSRFADGRAVLRSCIREYLCSEHMHALGIPTTRALSVIATREGVRRETVEPGAVMSRFAQSHIRFGHFEYFHHRNMKDEVRALADHLLEYHFPELAAEDDPYSAMFREVTARTARLMAKWQAVGFVHGVMNTDNMSILGLTIDYGPYGFLDEFQPTLITNHSDEGGRYVYANQPVIAHWNLRALAVALTSLVSMESLNTGLESYAPAFEAAWQEELCAKLGFAHLQEGDEKLADTFMSLLAETGSDFTSSWHALSHIAAEQERADVLPDDPRMSSWLENWQARLGEEEGDAVSRLRAANPKFVLRNWVAETAIRAVEDEFDLGTLDRIFRIVTHPYDDHDAEDDLFAGGPPDEFRNLAVSCSA